MKIAGFEKRIFSYLVDMLIPIAISITLFFTVFIHIHLNTMFFLYVIALSIVSISYLLINTLLTYLTNGYTLGNLIFGIRVISNKNSKLKFVDCFLKYCFLAFPMCAFINMFYMIIVHSERTIFDRLSSTDSLFVRVKF